MQPVDVDVCVVGAGYAGLVAARTISRAGRSVVVLEARDRVGGRVWTQKLDDGTAIDIGGTWVGPEHDAIRALATEYGVGFDRTNSRGTKLMVRSGKVGRYEGASPRIGPLALVSLGLAMARLDAMARRVPPTLDASHGERPGLLCSLAFGPTAERLAKLGSAERRTLLLETLTQRFGPKAAKPEHYVELEWGAE